MTKKGIYMEETIVTEMETSTESILQDNNVISETPKITPTPEQKNAHKSTKSSGLRLILIKPRLHKKLILLKYFSKEWKYKSMNDIVEGMVDFYNSRKKSI